MEQGDEGVGRVQVRSDRLAYGGEPRVEVLPQAGGTHDGPHGGRDQSRAHAFAHGVGDGQVQSVGGLVPVVEVAPHVARGTEDARNVIAFHPDVLLGQEALLHLRGAFQLPPGSGFRRSGGPAPEQGVDPGLEFAGAERLADVLIGAVVQAGQLVEFVCPGGEHHDERVRKFPQKLAHFQPVEVRQVQVQCDQVGFAASDLLHARQARGRLGDVEALLDQDADQQSADVRVVFDDHSTAGFGGRDHALLLPY